MCRIMSSVISVWPHLAHIGRDIVLEYLAQGVQDRLSAPLVTCLAALGRQALVNGLSSHMDLINSIISGENLNVFCPGLLEAIMNSAHVFIGPTSQKFDSELAHLDAALYDIIGDALIPRRIHCICPEKIEEPPPEENDFDAGPYSPPKPVKKKSKFKIHTVFPIKKEENGLYNDSVFEGANRPIIRRQRHYIQLNYTGSRPLLVKNIKYDLDSPFANSFPNGNRHNLDRKITITLANGLLTRFKYKLPGEKRLAANFNFYTL